MAYRCQTCIQLSLPCKARGIFNSSAHQQWFNSSAEKFEFTLDGLGVHGSITPIRRVEGQTEARQPPPSVSIHLNTSSLNNVCFFGRWLRLGDVEGRPRAARLERGAWHRLSGWSGHRPTQPAGPSGLGMSIAWALRKKDQARTMADQDSSHLGLLCLVVFFGTGYLR